MEAVTLALPLNTLGSPASAEADGQPLKPEESGGALDFAALLAAGVQLAQAAANPAAAALPQSEQHLRQDDEPADSALLQAMPVVVPDGAVVLQQSTAAPSAGARAATHSPATAKAIKPELAGEGHGLFHGGSTATSLAAEAAMIAAHPGKDAPVEGVAVGSAMPQQIERFSRELQAATAAEPAPLPELAAHALHAAPVEHRSVATQPTALLSVEAPVGGPGFADALSRQVVWMADKDAQVAELRVNPPELGPVEVRLTLTGDAASAQFVSPHAEVRNAIESSLERLREAMAQAGIQLGNATVSAESFRDQNTAQSEARESRHGYRDERSAADPSLAVTAPSTRIQRGLVDLFA